LAPFWRELRYQPRRPRPKVPLNIGIDRQSSMSDPALAGLVKAVAAELALLLKAEITRSAAPEVQPALLTVKQSAIYLGRSEQSVQHLIFQRELPVVRVGRRVHLDGLRRTNTNEASP
jgi:excisionase family DNA binding protein